MEGKGKAREGKVGGRKGQERGRKGEAKCVTCKRTQEGKESLERGAKRPIDSLTHEPTARRGSERPADKEAKWLTCWIALRGWVLANIMQTLTCPQLRIAISIDKDMDNGTDSIWAQTTTPSLAGAKCVSVAGRCVASRPAGNFQQRLANSCCRYVCTPYLMCISSTYIPTP